MKGDEKGYKPSLHVFKQTDGNGWPHNTNLESFSEDPRATLAHSCIENIEDALEVERFTREYRHIQSPPFVL